MKKQKLNYRFHNPNPAAITADYLLSILIEANRNKAAQALKAAANTIPEGPVSEESYRFRNTIPPSHPQA